MFARARLNEARQVAMGHATLGPHRASVCRAAQAAGTCGQPRRPASGTGPQSPEVPQAA